MFSLKNIKRVIFSISPNRGKYTPVLIALHVLVPNLKLLTDASPKFHIF